MDLAFLHPLYEHPGPWASVYVDTSSHTESTPHERSLVAQAVSRELAAQGADEPTRAAVQRAVDELRHTSEPHGRAFFARSGEVVLDPPLAYAPPGTSAHWAPLPRATPLLGLAGEDPVCVVAYVDRRGADFELRDSRGSQDAGTVAGRQWPVHLPALRAGSEHGRLSPTALRAWGDPQRHFQLRVENTWEHNAAEIADALAVCQEETRADLLILVGEERERHSVRKRLPQRLQDLVVEARHSTGSRLLDDDVERARAEHVHRRAAEELERFLAARAPDAEGRTAAVESVPALVEAAREHRIYELLVRPGGPDARREVWIGEDPDQLAVRRTDLKALGEQHSWAARADDALLRSAVATDAPALSVTAATADEVPVGGLGALLRWN